MSRRLGSIKWFGDTDKSPARIECIGEISDPTYRQVLIRNEALPLSKEALSPGTQVTYEVVRGSGNWYCWAYDIKLLDDETEIDFLKRRFDSIWPNVWHPVVRSYFAVLDDADVVTEALRKAKSLEEHQNLIALLRYIPERVYSLSTAEPLRELRMRVQQADLHQRLIAKGYTLNPPLQPTVPSMQGARLSVNRDETQRQLWTQLLSIFTQGPLHTATWSPLEAYSLLERRDYELALLWTEEAFPDDHEIARVLSARAAELVAQRFYRSLGHKVTDIAITQVDRQGQDWRTHDLLLDEQTPVDVKNARTPVSQRDRYVEHCVPNFKETRDATSVPVAVAGVLSPYLKLEFIRTPANLRFPVRDIAFLGQTSRCEIESLTAKYNSERFTIVPTLLHGSRSRRQSHVIPPWLYDYPDEFYRREAIAAENLRAMAEAELPSYTDFTEWHLNPLPALIASRVTMPESWTNRHIPHYGDFVRRLFPAANQRVKLPNVFLAILTHFVDRVCTDVGAEYSPSIYERLLYAGSTPFGHKRPLGLYDPLEICWGLCNALKIIWRQGIAHDIVRFRRFRFQGMGLLRGTRQDNGQEVTLLAYCGGFVPDKGKCGYSPLIWGLHDTCPECNHLICPECSFCSEGCTLGHQRTSQIGAKRSYSTDELPFEPIDGFLSQGRDDLAFDDIPF